MKVEENLKNGGEPDRFTQEEALRRLAEVRTRYGIQLAQPHAGPIAVSSSGALKQPMIQEPQPAPIVPSTRLVPPDRMRPDPALKQAGVPRKPVFPSDRESFHFLVRIAECKLVLHCEVKADSAGEAKGRVERIPNLIEWRELSFQELNEIMGNKDLSAE